MDFGRLAKTVLGTVDAIRTVAAELPLGKQDAANLDGILDDLRKAADGIRREKPVTVKKTDVAAVVKDALKDPEILALVVAAVVKDPANVALVAAAIAAGNDK